MADRDVPSPTFEQAQLESDPVMDFCQLVVVGGRHGDSCLALRDADAAVAFEPADKPWRVMEGEAGTGVALFSAVTEDAQSSCMRLQIAADRVLAGFSFHYTVSSEPQWDRLNVFLQWQDGAADQRLAIFHGEQPWSSFSHTVSDQGRGVATGISLCYSKDRNRSVGEDWAGVSSIRLQTIAKSALVATELELQAPTWVLQSDPQSPEIFELRIRVFDQLGFVFAPGLGESLIVLQALDARVELGLQVAGNSRWQRSRRGELHHHLSIGRPGTKNLSLSVDLPNPSQKSTLLVSVGNASGLIGRLEIPLRGICMLTSPGSDDCGRFTTAVERVSFIPPAKAWRLKQSAANGREALFSPQLGRRQGSCLRLHIAFDRTLTDWFSRDFVSSEHQDFLRIHAHRAGGTDTELLALSGDLGWRSPTEFRMVDQPPGQFVGLSWCYEKGYTVSHLLDRAGVQDIAFRSVKTELSGIRWTAPQRILWSDFLAPVRFRWGVRVLNQFEAPAVGAFPEPLNIRISSAEKESVLTASIVGDSNSVVTGRAELALPELRIGRSGFAELALQVLPPVGLDTSLALTIDGLPTEQLSGRLALKIVHFCNLALQAGSGSDSCRAIQGEGAAISFDLGAGPWRILPAEDGEELALFSPEIEHRQRNCLRLRLNQDSILTELSFRYLVDSQPRWDILSVHLHREDPQRSDEEFEFSGASPWTDFSHAIDQFKGRVFGVSWCYQKDYSATSGADWGAVNGISLVTLPEEQSTVLAGVALSGPAAMFRTNFRTRAHYHLQLRAINALGLPLSGTAIENLVISARSPHRDTAIEIAMSGGSEPSVSALGQSSLTIRIGRSGIAELQLNVLPARGSSTSLVIEVTGLPPGLTANRLEIPVTDFCHLVMTGGLAGNACQALGGLRQAAATVAFIPSTVSWQAWGGVDDRGLALATPPLRDKQQVCLQLLPLPERVLTSAVLRLFF